MGCRVTAINLLSWLFALLSCYTLRLEAFIGYTTHSWRHAAWSLYRQCAATSAFHKSRLEFYTR